MSVFPEEEPETQEAEELASASPERSSERPSPSSPLSNQFAQGGLRILKGWILQLPAGFSTRSSQIQSQQPSSLPRLHSPLPLTSLIHTRFIFSHLYTCLRSLHFFRLDPNGTSPALRAPTPPSGTQGLFFHKPGASRKEDPSCTSVFLANCMQPGT